MSNEADHSRSDLNSFRALLSIAVRRGEDSNQVVNLCKSFTK